jgi:4-hydroxyproline epimerase
MNAREVRRVQVIDSHTGGEPTRVVIGGGPDLGGGTVADRLRVFREQHDSFRSAVVNEPRGSDALVGALLTEPADPACAAGVLFFNNVGCLGMCGHGAIGLVVTLAHLGRIGPGEHLIETPVGVVTVRLHESGAVSVGNVPAYRRAKDVCVTVEGYDKMHGDVAWGGNWFFLVEEHDQELALSNVEALTGFCRRIRQALQREGVTGRGGQEIDHVELFSTPCSPGADSRNFVLCPGGAYDRSPCGTGTSAKMACLFADGKLREGDVWRQESITGSVFEGRIRVVNGEVIPTITGRAFVTAEATLLFDPADPFCGGIQVFQAVNDLADTKQAP